MSEYNLAEFISARKKHGLSLSEMAEKAGVSEKTIDNFEGGQRPRSHWGHKVLEAYRTLGDFAQVKVPDAPPKKKRGRPKIEKALSEVQPEEDDDEGYDECMKPNVGPGRGRRVWRGKIKPDASLDLAWLRLQVDRSMKGRGLIADESIVAVTKDQLVEFGRLVLLAAGRNVG